MLTLNSHHLSEISKAHGLTPREQKSMVKNLEPYLERIAARDQGFYRVIDDTHIVKEIEAYAQKIRGKYDFIVVLGIGGSALGMLCLQQSLEHLYAPHFFRRRDALQCVSTTKKMAPCPTLFVLDNIDPEQIAALEDVIDLKKTLFIVITKSGGTPETLAVYQYFRSLVETHCHASRISDHFVFITDPQEGHLRKIAEQEGITAFPVPPNVGGRFSVLTAVGLLPAALIGIDIRALLSGARETRDQFLSTDPAENLSFQLASIQYLLSQKGKSINVLIPYSARLIRFADWFRQLLAESTGKEKKVGKKTVNVGLTPINALGVTDQHSQFQLYNQGPNDKLFLFIEVKNQGRSLPINAKNISRSKLKAQSSKLFSNHTFQSLMHAELQASQKALQIYDRPSVTLQIDRVDEEHLGRLFMLFMGATAFLGEMLGIDAFNQPGVELGKKLTREILMTSYHP